MPQVETCTAVRHGVTRVDWRAGCRCPGAHEAHEQRGHDRRHRNRYLPAQVDAEGNCTAERHGPSARAWRRGCRCPETIARHDADLARNRAALAAKRPTVHPWTRWRGPDRVVGRWNLFALLHGIVDAPTLGERVAAVRILARMPNRWSSGINDNLDIAAVIGEDNDTVRHLKETSVRWRKNRHKRRLADVKLREHRRAQAIARGHAHDASGHPLHPWWLALAYDRMTREIDDRRDPHGA